MTRSIKDFSKVGRNKYTRKLLATQKELKRGRYSKVDAPTMSRVSGRRMPYMFERNGKSNVRRQDNA